VSYAVLLTEDAAADLRDVYTYMAEHDSANNTEYVLDEIEKKFVSLRELPERGVPPKELMALGIRDYREIFFKPYRIIYRIITTNVYVYLIADGRRDMQTLLQRRLLGGLVLLP
jgi:toxin ParE1/3/4